MFNYNVCTKNNNQTFTGKQIPVKMIKKMTSEIKQAKKIAIVIHQSPDNDAVGSAMPIFDYLKKQGKDVVIFANKNELNGLGMDAEKYTLANAENTRNIDLAFMLDCNKVKRIPQNFADVFNNIKKVIGLDHHDITSTTQQALRIDKTACSTCSLVYRFFERAGFKPSIEDLEHIYSGFISDAQKSKIIKIENIDNTPTLIKLPKFNKDKNSKEILEKIEMSLPQANRNKILMKLDILSTLSDEEKNFQKRIFSNIQITPNGKLAYVVIPPNDPQWATLGMDNTRTSAIMGNFRQTIIGDFKKNNNIPDDIKIKLSKVKGAMVFYRTNDLATSPYQMSITTKGHYAKKLRTYIKTTLDPDYIGDGHPHRQGGRILTTNEEDVKKFINLFMTASEKVG